MILRVDHHFWQRHFPFPNLFFYRHQLHQIALERWPIVSDEIRTGMARMASVAAWGLGKCLLDICIERDNPLFCFCLKSIVPNETYAVKELLCLISLHIINLIPKSFGKAYEYLKCSLLMIDLLQSEINGLFFLK